MMWKYLSQIFPFHVPMYSAINMKKYIKQFFIALILGQPFEALLSPPSPALPPPPQKKKKRNKKKSSELSGE